MTTSRYPNQFKVRGSGSPNIISIGVVSRSLAKSHAWSLAAWLVTYVGDMPAFLNVLIDVWVSRYGTEQTPEWLFQLNPGWKPFDPPARPVAPVAVRADAPVPLPTPLATPRQGGGQGGGQAPPRFTLPDGTPLDADAVRAIGEDAARTIGAGIGAGKSGNGSRAPTSLPTSLPKPVIDVPADEGGGSDGE